MCTYAETIESKGTLPLRKLPYLEDKDIAAEEVREGSLHRTIDLGTTLPSGHFRYLTSSMLRSHWTPIRADHLDT